MIICDIKHRFLSAEAYDIYAACMYMPSWDKFAARARTYASDARARVFGALDGDKIIGICAVKLNGDNSAEILGIAAKPARVGVGSRLIDCVMSNLPIEVLVAETDSDAVGFYMKRGFAIENIGTGRYKCALRATGWERRNRAGFDDMAAEYERARPEWPGEIFDDIFAYCAPANAVEIGAGTGKATRALLSRGVNVTAVEISPRMAEYIENRFADCGDFRVITSAFEDAALDAGAYDMVCAASAFHWVDAEIGCPKALRLLRPDGALALFRYNARDFGDNGRHAYINDIFYEYYDKYYNLPRREFVKLSHKDFLTPREIYRGFKLYDLRDYGFVDTVMKFYDATINYTGEEYVAFLNTLADHRKLPHDVKTAFHGELRRAITARGGVDVDYVFQLYMGRKPRLKCYEIPNP